MRSPCDQPVVALGGEVPAVGCLDGAVVGGREEAVARQGVDEHAAAEQGGPGHDADDPQNPLPPLK